MIPEVVRAAQVRSAEAGFEYSSDERVGRLLAVLAASVPSGGRILELGTGVGVGTAWMVSGLHDRLDVQLISVELDAARALLVRQGSWPGYVQFVTGDAVEQLAEQGQFDLIFADAQGGKWDRLDLTVQALRSGGVLLVDDMMPADWWDPEHREQQDRVRAHLLSDPSLVVCEMDWATGVILSARVG